MKIAVNDDEVEEVAAEIAADEQEGKTEVIEDARDERVDARAPFKARLARFIKSGVGKTIIGFLLLVAIVLAVPMTRYAFLGLMIAKPATITVVDSITGKPVSDATIHFGQNDGTTDSKGVATINGTSVGDHVLKVEKKYYATANTDYLVPIFGSAHTTVKLTATGRVASVTVTNGISGQPLSGATVQIGDTSATSGDNGVASIALATATADQTGQVTLAGYNTASVTVNTKDMAPQVAVKLVPSGNVYFISNRTGAYDVMSSALDGTNQKVVLAGTGSEVGNELQLLPTADNSYLAYVARRNGDTAPAIYIITTSNGAVNEIPNSVGAGAIGWINDTFYYSTFNYNSGVITDKRQQLLAYNAANGQVTTVDASHLVGNPGQYNYTYAEQGLGNFVLVGNRIYYAKCWSYGMYYTGSQDQQASLMAVVNGSAISLKDVTQNGGGYCSTAAATPNQIYYIMNFTTGAQPNAYVYAPGKAVESTSSTSAQAYNTNFPYLISPDGTKTFWTETRDGKQVSFIGDANGNNAKQVSAADYTAYGWFTDKYVLYSKGGSQLYIAAVGDTLDGSHKITDYFSPQRPIAG